MDCFLIFSAVSRGLQVNLFYKKFRKTLALNA